MEIESNYINQVAQANKTNVVSPYGETKEEIDYSEYNISEIRDIPYAEAKENYDQIKERITKLSEEDLSKAESIEHVNAYMQLSTVNYSDNENMNETVYETMAIVESPALFSFELQTNLEDYYYGKDTTASFRIDGTDGSNHANKELNKTQLSNINMDDFINKMLETFTNDYNTAKDPTLKEQYKSIVDGYNLFKESYDQAVTEPYYA